MAKVSKQARSIRVQVPKELGVSWVYGFGFRVYSSEY